MNNPYAWPPPGLEPGADAVTRWVAITARSLCGDAQREVRESAEARYESAYREALQDGMNESAARARAVAALGDPFGANKSYRQTFLTELQEKNFSSQLGVFYLIYSGVIMLALFAYGVWLRWDNATMPRETILILMFPAAAAFAILIHNGIMHVAKRRRHKLKKHVNATIEDWLEVATRDLCYDARERVREEVEAHYAAARDEALIDNLSEEMANAWALTVLGDAREANKNFTALHLTATDLQSLEGSLHSMSNTKRRLLTSLLCIALGLYAHQIFVFPPGNLIDEVGSAGSFILLFSMVIRTFLKGRMARIALIAEIVLAFPAAFGIVFGFIAINADRFFEIHEPSMRMALVSILIAAPAPFVLWMRWWPLIKKLSFESDTETTVLKR